MSRISDQITTAYPSLALSLLSLPPEEASDLRWMIDLASYCVDAFEAGNVEEVRFAFELAEYLVASSVNEERDAAVLEFLETVQNVASHRKFGFASFEQFLGPQSQAAWTELIKVWRGKTSLAQIVASETGASLRPRWWQFWRRRDQQLPRDPLSQVENPELRKIIEQITRE